MPSLRPAPSGVQAHLEVAACCAAARTPGARPSPLSSSPSAAAPAPSGVQAHGLGEYLYGRGGAVLPRDVQVRRCPAAAAAQQAARRGGARQGRAQPRPRGVLAVASPRVHVLCTLDALPSLHCPAGSAWPAEWQGPTGCACTPIQLPARTSPPPRRFCLASYLTLPFRPAPLEGSLIPSLEVRPGWQPARDAAPRGALASLHRSRRPAAACAGAQPACRRPTLPRRRAAPTPVRRTLRPTQRGLAVTDRLGLLGASVTQHPEFTELLGWLMAPERAHVRLSIASVRTNTVTPDLAAALSARRGGPGVGWAGGRPGGVGLHLGLPCRRLCGCCGRCCGAWRAAARLPRGQHIPPATRRAPYKQGCAPALQLCHRCGTVPPSRPTTDRPPPACRGTRSLTVAVESGSERVRAIVNKKLAQDEIVRCAQAAQVRCARRRGQPWQAGGDGGRGGQAAAASRLG